MNTRVVSLVLSIVLLCAVPAMSQQTLATWTFDDGAGDASAVIAADAIGGRNGALISNTATGVPSWITSSSQLAVTARAGNAGALSFRRVDGSSLVRIDGTNLKPQRLSVELWFRHNGFPGLYTYLMTRRNAFALYVDNDAGLRWHVAGTNGALWADSVYPISSKPAGSNGLERDIWDGRWHHTVMTFDGTTLRSWIDGVEVGSGKSLGYVINLDYDYRNMNAADAYQYTYPWMYIGGYQPQFTAYNFPGDIDEVTMWDYPLPPADVVVRKGPLVHWAFEEDPGTQTTVDRGSSRSDGLLGSTSAADVNDPAVVANGKRGRAFSFNGEQFIRVPNRDSLRPRQLTVEVWVRSRTSVGLHWWNWIINKQYADDSKKSFEMNSLNGGAIQFSVYNTNGVGVASPPAQAHTIVGDTWHHLVGTFDGVKVRMYHNGVERGDGAAVPAGFEIGYGPSNESSVSYIGSQWGPHWTFRGEMDELTIWDRALTTEEVARRAGVERTCAISVQAPPNISVSAADSCSAVVTDGALGTATLTGECSNSVVIERRGVPANNIFPFGLTTITYVATDRNGISVSATQIVSVADVTPPRVAYSAAAITAALDASCAATVPDIRQRVSATDNCTSQVRLTQSPAPGSLVRGDIDIVVNAADAASNSVSVTVPMRVTNAAPVIDVGAAAYTVFEGSDATLAVSATDPEGSAVDVRWDLDGDGSSDATGAAVVFSAAAVDGPAQRTVRVTATDSCGASNSASIAVNVINAPPVIADVFAPVAPVALGTAVTISGTFSDPADSHVVTVQWGNGATSTSAADDALRSFVATHTYAAAGVYTVNVTLADDDGASATRSIQYVVVYDASGGFVTGGGWFTSSPGSYTPDPTVTGKATFGFSSKYAKGAEKPSGNTQFNLAVAGFRFHSTEYDWLVVAGAKAMFKGRGSVNGEGDYGFLLSATDGGAPGGGEDRLRIKVWNRSTGAVVYDNDASAADDAEPRTTIGGGNIVINR